MLEVRDLFGNVEPLDGWGELYRKRKVNGEKTIRFLLFPNEKNLHGFSMVQTESQITFDGEPYIIKSVSNKTMGTKYYKDVTAIHKFYVDMINKQQPKIHNGSITFLNVLNFIFEDMPYSYSVVGNFTANAFENFGNENRLALLQKVLERYKAEIEIDGSIVYFKKRVGDDTDFQFRYKHNVLNMENLDDSMNLATVIRGNGAEGITAYYRSPNADIFGEIDADPVDDERFTSEATLLEEMKSRLQDAPIITVTINFADLRASGYPYTVPNEGDRIFVIYEPMDDFQLETRILEIDETFKENPNPNGNPVAINTEVVLSNHKKSFAGTTFDQIKKSLSKVINEDGVIRFDFLDEAVKQATEAIKSAQTELEFVNGIIAREKTNPNELVVVNSKGIGISTDGGQTFRTALTAKGGVADVINSGTLNANLVKVTGAVNIVRPDNAVAVLNGVMQGDFLIDRATPFYMDPEVTVSNNFFMTRSFTSVIADALYFKHAGRYLTLVVWARTLQSGCRVDLVNMDSSETVKVNATLGFPYNNVDDSTFQTITIDLGRPTFRNIGVYLKFNSYAAGVPTYMRYTIKTISG
ncbi:phage tail protein [Cytobacillus horneckiae]|uniref:phage tail protein n=1 Tax=Cytobacillus horneckiae TaxID=549687 RepID=UPI002E2030E9|nr:phage tail protein [Cytobacillus horneckiae]